MWHLFDLYDHLIKVFIRLYSLDFKFFLARRDKLILFVKTFLDPLHGDTSLHICSRNKNFEELNLMFDLNGDFFLKNNYNQNAFQLITERFDKEDGTNSVILEEIIRKLKMKLEDEECLPTKSNAEKPDSLLEKHEDSNLK